MLGRPRRAQMNERQMNHNRCSQVNPVLQAALEQSPSSPQQTLCTVAHVGNVVPKQMSSIAFTRMSSIPIQLGFLPAWVLRRLW